MTLGEAREALASLARRTRRTRTSAGSVKLELAGRVAHVRIDHPGARGALTIRMMVELADAVATLGAWDGVLVVLSSTDPLAFCSGGHLGELTRAIDAPEAALRMCTAMTTVLDALLALDATSVSALDGPALGGGAELCTATDFRVASAGARIHFVQARLGIAPGWGGAGRLARLVGRRTALRILTSSRPLSPGEAAEVGLVDHRSDASAVEAALDWVDDLLALPPEAARAVKRQIARPDDEAAAFASVWGGPAHREALARLGRHHR